MSTYRAARSRGPAASRAKILGAVHDLLAHGAFHASTVEDVADRAGVSRATVYQQFGSRLGLVDGLCDVFDANPALLEIRRLESVDELIEYVVRFWMSEEQVLAPLYGMAAVDPAAAALVERQRADRRGEIERLAGGAELVPVLLLLTSFETYEELRRHAGLSDGEVVATLRDLWCRYRS